jgi:hypothetical protein
MIVNILYFLAVVWYKISRIQTRLSLLFVVTCNSLWRIIRS